MITSLHYEIIPHDSQAYNTVGNFWEDPPGSGHWQVRVSDVGNWRMAVLVFIHEIVELSQTEHEGIAESDITEFDKTFEANKTDPESEPGNDPKAPYHCQHTFAECIERLLAQRLDVEWGEYEAELNKVYARRKPTTPAAT